MKKVRRLVLSGAKEVAEQAATGIRAAAPHAGHALEWGREQHTRLKRQLPEADTVEAWIQKNATMFGWEEKPKSSSLEHLEQVLTKLVSAILQKSDKHTRIFISTVIGKLGGVAAAGGITGLIASLGTASTGTAIASLSGAAATTAQLYWIGSLVGLGVTGGTVLLTAGGLGAGVAAGMLGKRKVFEKERSEDDLQEHESAILVACVTMIKSVKEQRESGQEPSPAEMGLVAEHVLFPLVHQINQHWDTASLEENGKSECRPFSQTLAILHRRKLDQCRTELARIALSAMMTAAGR